MSDNNHYDVIIIGTGAGGGTPSAVRCRCKSPALPESSLDLMEHFQRCTACSRESEERRNMRARLQAAVREARVPQGLEDRVRDRLRRTREPRPKGFHLMSIAAALAVCFGSWIAYQHSALRLTTASQELYVAEISGQVASILRVGLGDHLHCALLRQRARRSPGEVDKLPLEFKELIPIVHQHVPADLPLVLAHRLQLPRPQLRTPHLPERPHSAFAGDRKQAGGRVPPRRDSASGLVAIGDTCLYGRRGRHFRFRLISRWNRNPISGSPRIGIEPLVQAHSALDKIGQFGRLPFYPPKLYTALTLS